MNSIATTDKAFLETLRLWLTREHEILVMIRFSRAAGAKSFELFSSFDDLLRRLHELPAQAAITAFRKKQLPLRGTVDDEFVRRCVSEIRENSEFLVLETTPRSAGHQVWFHEVAGESHAKLIEALDQSRGRLVAVGQYPPWLEQSPDVLTGIVPASNGLVLPGVY